ncbi:efflux RND transporter periplasmic adaptor subunit [Undibacterium luofuense]|nr:efflux RND transporter periplasmic adaptor subunit [Undibacterium luofuense]
MSGPSVGMRRKMMLSVTALSLIAGLSACSKKTEEQSDIRPVRAIVANNVNTADGLELAGEVRPRIESRLGFRVPGKILSRQVELGSVVKKGQVLMQLDPQDLALAQAQAKAALSAAESNRDLAQAELKRYQELRAKNFVAASVLEAKETTFKSAQSTYEQAQAGFKSQSNQASYAQLVADADGVVTGIDAEVGQVVAAGTPVVRVAQTGDMDVVVGVPENKVNAIRKLQDVKVRIWSDKDKVVTAKLRELSPVADPVTRTFLAKLALPKDNPDIRLGMTANVSLQATEASPAIVVPVTALYQEKGSTAVWIVQDGKVNLVPVVISGTQGENVLLASGVKSGQTVVTAGVHLLKAGQQVSILGSESAKPAATGGQK